MKAAEKIKKTADHPACPYCDTSDPRWHLGAKGDGVIVKAACVNPDCGAIYHWHCYTVTLFISTSLPDPSKKELPEDSVDTPIGLTFPIPESVG